MSVEATLWAWGFTKKEITATEKIVLLSMADRADENHECYPSKERLAFDTCLDRKTVFSCISSLETKGLITKTGRKEGRLKIIDVYKLLGVKSREKKEQYVPKYNRTENGTVKNSNSPENGTLNRTENGTVNRTENGTQNLSVEPIIRTLCVGGSEAITTHTQIFSKKITDRFSEKFALYDVTIEDLFASCKAYYEQQGKKVVGSMFAMWIQREKIENHPTLKQAQSRNQIQKPKCPFTQDQLETHDRYKVDVRDNKLVAHWPDEGKRAKAKDIYEQVEAWLQSCPPRS